MRMLELFCGTKSISSVFKRGGYEIVSVDIIQEFEPTYCGDILTMDFRDRFDVVWASPPCTTFSIASVGHHWKFGMPSDDAVIGNKILAKTLEIINLTRPKYWFIENPRGMMRKMPIMEHLPKKTITYCQYGDKRMKPTDIWTNCKHWMPKPMCSNGDKCHEAAPRGARAGTQGIDGVKDRSRIPEALAVEIFEAVQSKQQQELFEVMA